MNSKYFNASIQREQTHRFKNAGLAPTTLLILIGLVTPSFALGQTKSVQMTFSDQDSLNSPFDGSQAALATGVLSIQESDFEPKSERKPKLKPELEPDPKLEPRLEPKPEPKSGETQDEKPDIDLDQSQQPEPDEATQTPELTDEKEAEQPLEKLKSDEPVDAPSFELTDEPSEESPSETEDQIESEKTVQPLFDGYRLPTVADVRAPISFAPLARTSQHDPGGLLAADSNTNFAPRFVGSNSNYSEVSGIPAAAKYKTWRAHNVYHRPTYFEDQNLELNGNRRPFQNVASAVSFIGTIPRIPYLIGEHHPREKIYTYGEDRPGDPAPFRVFQRTGNRRGRVFQTIATLGLVLP